MFPYELSVGFANLGSENAYFTLKGVFMTANGKTKLIFVFYLLIMIVACSGGFSDKAEQEVHNIKNVILEQQNAWNKGDISAYMQAYWNSDSLLFIGKNGPKYGWQTTLGNYKKSYPDKETMGQLKFTFLKIEILSPINAVVIGKWELTRQNDNPKGHFSLIMRKTDGVWKVVIDHSS